MKLTPFKLVKALFDVLLEAVDWVVEAIDPFAMAASDKKLVSWLAVIFWPMLLSVVIVIMVLILIAAGTVGWPFMLWGRLTRKEYQ